MEEAEWEDALGVDASYRVDAVEEVPGCVDLGVVFFVHPPVATAWDGEDFDVVTVPVGFVAYSNVSPWSFVFV